MKPAKSGLVLIAVSHASGPAPITKYNIDTKSGKDKSLSKLHVSVWKEDLEKTKKYVRSDQQDDLDGAKRFKLPSKKDKELLVNSRDRFGRTPLHLCASNGNVDMLWQLLR